VRGTALRRTSGWNRCVFLSQDKWSAAYSVSTILVSLQSLLGGGFAHTRCSLNCPNLTTGAVACPEPNNDSPLNGYAAQLWDKQEGERGDINCSLRPTGVMLRVCVCWVRGRVSTCPSCQVRRSPSGGQQPGIQEVTKGW
jgi:hypothetical protein